MAIKRKMTIEPIPKVDTSPSYSGESRTQGVNPPNGDGWTLENSFRGEYNLFYVWKKGDTHYDYGYENCWTSIADDIDNEIVGGGQKFTLSLSTTDTEKSVEGMFLPFETYIHGGSLFWEGDQGDKHVNLDVVATASVLQEGNTVSVDSATNKIVPSFDQTGTHGLTNDVTVVDNKKNQGYWDFTDGKLIPNFDMEGHFDLYNIEITVARLINNIDLMPSAGGQKTIESGNAWKVFPNYKFKFTAFNPSESNFKVTMAFHLIKKKTVSY